ncbi:hypothetical protein [Amycolatopsis viridis]|uniref:Uncharacterized protein n=1 Tax=Amycolatopsis viridis TaxID=185678 RepID=A0ABX0T0W6_9PSEU|nr:hypothetical protein [Amycolatopsis viridis]NIH81200.1 hypothetical protein [Amycolatopsis viridis]
MLFIVLLLVLAALGLLISALITASSLWAWLSIGLSVVAGLLLVADFARRRAARRRVAAGESGEEPAAAPAAPDDDEPATATDQPETEASPETPPAEEPAKVTAEPEQVADEQDVAVDQTALLPAAGELVGTAEEGEPGVERTDPADTETVSGLDVEVVVVDEHPRYHLTDCGWLTGRDTIPISVSEARDLGFTPCARCTPDAHLAKTHRAKSKA